MISFRVVMKDTALMIAVIIGGILIFKAASWTFASSAERAAGECSMLVIDNRVEPQKADEYRRACMASKDFGMLPSCWGKDLSVASCFAPKWMFWITKI